ncbi:p21-C-terminal region-binding protein-domain-containing protein [Pyronema omphalodes]|nr:p21-C-terminal region-binding protein-domain-containing protein [Pyronema omphalodes]
MGKRKDHQDDGMDVDMDSTAEETKHNSDSDDEDMDIVNVDFEWFDPQPAHDFHGIKTLLRQLFDADSTLFDLSALTDLILSQPLLGTTVKTDGNESDPYAFLTVINLHEHASNPAIATLANYLLSKSASNPALHSTLKQLFSTESTGQVGLILTERLINMPPQIVPPMYKMLLEEIEWAVEEKEPYNFTHFLVLSKSYTEVASKLDEMEARPSKKWKKAKAKKSETFYYHPEDEIIRRGVGEENAADFKFEKQGDAADSKRAFSDMGIQSQGLLMLVEKNEFGKMVGDLENLFKP